MTITKTIASNPELIKEISLLMEGYPGWKIMFKNSINPSAVNCFESYQHLNSILSLAKQDNPPGSIYHAVVPQHLKIDRNLNILFKNRFPDSLHFDIINGKIDIKDYSRKKQRSSHFQVTASLF